MALDQEEVILKSVSFSPWIEGCSYEAGVSRALSAVLDHDDDDHDAERWLERIQLHDREDETRRHNGDFAGIQMPPDPGSRFSLASAEAVLATETHESDWEQVLVAVEKAQLDSPLAPDIFSRAAPSGSFGGGRAIDRHLGSGGVRRAPSGLKKKHDNLLKF